MDLEREWLYFSVAHLITFSTVVLTKEKYKYNSGLIQTHYMLYAIVTIVLLALKTIIGHFG